MYCISLHEQENILEVLQDKLASNKKKQKRFINE